VALLRDSHVGHIGRGEQTSVSVRRVESQMWDCLPDGDSDLTEVAQTIVVAATLRW